MAEEKEKVDSSGESSLKVPKHRSPNYPSIGIEKALERARALQVVAKHHPLPIAAALEVWKYKSGAGNQIVAALKSFGLIEVKGEKENRQIRLTDAAIRILGNAPNHTDLLKEAALKPGIHKELWDKYEGELPADSIIRAYLRWERNFNEEAVDSFIAQFRDTIEFAKLKTSDKIRNDGDDDSDDDDDAIDDDSDDNQMMDAAVKKQKQQIRPPAQGLRAYPLYLPQKPPAGVLQVPETMSRKDYDLIKKQVDSFMTLILATTVVDDTEEEKGE